MRVDQTGYQQVPAAAVDDPRVGIAVGLVSMGLNTSRANTFAAVPGLPDYRLGLP